MSATRLMLVIAAVALPAIACGPAAAPATAPAAPPPTTQAAPSPASPVAAAASPSAVAAERVEGSVQSMAGTSLTLASGRTVNVPTAVRVTRATPITAADLHQGDYVAITAKRQPDNTLLASIVNVFPPSFGQVAPGQRPMPEGNLMTNASIDQIQGNTFTVTFPGGGAQVQLAPDATITRQVDASLGDVHQGDNVVMQVVDNTARTLTITAASARS